MACGFFLRNYKGRLARMLCRVVFCTKMAVLSDCRFRQPFQDVVQGLVAQLDCVLLFPLALPGCPVWPNRGIFVDTKDIFKNFHMCQELINWCEILCFSYVQRRANGSWHLPPADSPEPLSFLFYRLHFNSMIHCSLFSMSCWRVGAQEPCIYSWKISEQEAVKCRERTW